MIPHPNVEKNEGRGSILYIKKNLKHKDIPINSGGKHFEECIVQEINLNASDSLVCVNIYRRGESTQKNNDNLLELIKEIASTNNKQILIMGDLNLKEINWEYFSAPGTNLKDYNHRFIKCIRDSFLFQHVTENTRQRGNDTPSCLDLVFTSEEHMIKGLEYMAPLGRSDHSIIKFEIPCKMEKSPPK